MSVQNIEIQSINQPINHIMKMIGSKSESHRVLILAALAHGESVIQNLSDCEDVLLTKKALENLGIEITVHGDETRINGSGGHFLKHPKIMKFENSGTSFRFFMSLVCLQPNPVIIQGNNRMNERPIRELAEILQRGGAHIKYLEKLGFPPIEISGLFQGGQYYISTKFSSQFVSSLLLISPLLPQGLKIQSSGIQRSLPYIKLTVAIMQDFGVKVSSKFSQDGLLLQVNSPQKYISQRKFIEGDFSGAAFFFVACAILGGSITIEGLFQKSAQGDAYIIECLKEMGCNTSTSENSITLSRSPEKSLQSLNLDLGNYPDLVMPLAIAALFAKKPSKFTNIGHLRFKESDRLASLYKNLLAIGADVILTENSIKINPQPKYHGAQINPDDDHRIAMCFAIAGLVIPNMIIKNPTCVGKSFPSFFQELSNLINRSK